MESRESFLKVTFKNFFETFYIYRKVAKILQRVPISLHTASWDADAASNHSSFVKTETLTSEPCYQSTYRLDSEVARLPTQALTLLREPVPPRPHAAFHGEGGFVFSVFDSGGLAAWADEDGLAQVSETG